jgi:hypothetical protein
MVEQMPVVAGKKAISAELKFVPANAVNGHSRLRRYVAFATHVPEKLPLFSG